MEYTVSMAKVSAGLLMYRSAQGRDKLEVFLVHPGGPFFKNRDDVWSVPKGLVEPNEDLLAAAKREFTEETGIVIASDTKQSSLGIVNYNNKTVHAWAFEKDLPKDSPRFASEAGFQLKSDPTPQGWPENDKGEFFNLETAKKKILKGQLPFLERLSGLS